jgi:hypothetical protein
VSNQIATCHPEGFDSRTILVDEYYTYSEAQTGKIRGFVFWFEDCFDPQTYFVPVKPGYRSPERSLQDALEAWIDFLYEQRSGHIIGGNHDGSESYEEYAKDWDDPELERLTYGASFYAIDSDSWHCHESFINADGLSS